MGASREVERQQKKAREGRKKQRRNKERFKKAAKK